jgi:hypothetical protein
VLVGVAGWNIQTNSNDMYGLAHCWVLRGHPEVRVLFSGCSWLGPSNAVRLCVWVLWWWWLWWVGVWLCVECCIVDASILL